MSIQINDINVIDDDRNFSAAGIVTVGTGNSATIIDGTTGITSVGIGITMEGVPGNISIAGTLTAAGINFPGLLSNINPTNGATNVELDTSITLSFYFVPPTKGTGTIELRSGSVGGSLIESFDAASSGQITISGNDWILTPSSNLGYSTSMYLIIPDGAIDGYIGLNTTGADTYSFETEGFPPLGSSFEGGYLICTASSVAWVVAPSSSEVSRTWYCRNDAVTTANANAACGDWFVPTLGQLQNPGYACRTYWDSYCNSRYWSSSQYNSGWGWFVCFSNGSVNADDKPTGACVRAFRCVSY